ncbi:MAG: SagB/ThcOx family dehydrogenase [Planctomycetes bacterium]|jgi:SagB-type dehydrogenase family enzyme|nr:SagB/ThcOx family dehydrogenase [Planctomycetota bacterium]
MSVDTVFLYHERTKHHFRRYAASLGFLDWDTQPDPFRVFDGARPIPLARALSTERFSFDDLHVPDVRSPAALDADSIADFLRHSLAISAWKAAGRTRWALRVNPSSGNLHPTEGYLVLPETAGISDRPGVYHYRSDEHALEERAVLAEWPFGPGFLVGLSSIHWREAWKYGERAFRYCQHDAGHALCALRFAAALLGWRLTLLAGWPSERIGALLGLDRGVDFPQPREREEPELLAVVTPGPPGGEPAPGVPAAGWRGRANLLSPGHVDWEVIDEVAAASRTPGFPAVPAAGRAEPSRSGRPARDAREVIRTRRSAQAFDPDATMARDAFLRILGRTLPGAHAPFDALPAPPRIHLALFVHGVRDVAPGIYLLPRDPGTLPRLRAALRDDFRFAPVASDPPLLLLREGDVRDLARTLSCMQDIAGDSFFSLGMLADFEGPIRAEGGGAYRRLFQEAGLVGQVLYLEAEAEGVRGTGIGCYFDDPVHEVLGLSGRQFQSLYHFTVGAPVEDSRLTTLPAYGPGPRRA